MNVAMSAKTTNSRIIELGATKPIKVTAAVAAKYKEIVLPLQVKFNQLTEHQHEQPEDKTGGFRSANG